MKPADFLSYVSNIKEMSPGRHAGCCPSHDDTHPSFVITEAKDRLLIHCRAGCRTSDVLAAMGLSYRDLFYDDNQTKGTNRRTEPRRTEPLPYFYWNWRKACADLQLFIDEKFEKAEAILASTAGLSLQALSEAEFNEVINFVGRAYASIDQCERLYDTLFDIQQAFRTHEAVQKENNA